MEIELYNEIGKEINILYYSGLLLLNFLWQHMQNNEIITIRQSATDPAATPAIIPAYSTFSNES